MMQRKNIVVFNYWKEQYNLVSGSYAQKVLEVGRQKFKQLTEEHDIVYTEKISPTNNWKVKLYNLSEIRNLKEKLQEQK